MTADPQKVRDALETYISGVSADTGAARTLADSAVSDLKAQVADRDATIAALKAQVPPTPTPPPPAPTGYAFVVGADNNEGFGANTLAAFQAADKLIGPLRMRRSFPTLDQWPASVAADKAAGYVSFVSAGVPGGDYAGTAVGKYDAQITAVCKQLPVGTHVTMNHEPENDVPGPTWVAMFRRFYQVAKAANSGLMVGTAHLTYGWRNSAGVGGSGNNSGLQPPDQWDVKDDCRDFTAADTYSVKGQSLETDPQFRHWFDYFNKASAKPLGIAEYGQYAVPPGGTRDGGLEAKRASLIAADALWLAAQPKFTVCWLAWNGDGAQGSWRLQDAGSQKAWKAVAAKGRVPK